MQSILGTCIAPGNMHCVLINLILGVAQVLPRGGTGGVQRWHRLCPGVAQEASRGGTGGVQGWYKVEGYEWLLATRISHCHNCKGELGALLATGNTTLPANAQYHGVSATAGEGSEH